MEGQWCIQDLCEWVLKGQVSARGRVREGDVPPQADVLEYLVYEASCRVSYAVVALQYIAVSATNIIIYHIRFG